MSWECNGRNLGDLHCIVLSHILPNFEYNVGRFIVQEQSLNDLACRRIFGMNGGGTESVGLANLMRMDWPISCESRLLMSHQRENASPLSA
jgi:hypothetical protein